jgi:hypothetical protein
LNQSPAVGGQDSSDGKKRRSHDDSAPRHLLLRICVGRFLRAYIEGAVRGQKDKAFAMKTMGKYFRTDDRELLEESYESVIKNGFTVPPYPAGIASLLLDWRNRAQQPQEQNQRILLTAA